MVTRPTLNYGEPRKDGWKDYRRRGSKKMRVISDYIINKI